MNFMSKNERKRLVHMINNTKLDNENEIYDLAIELCNWSVRLRAEILRRNEFNEL